MIYLSEQVNRPDSSPEAKSAVLITVFGESRRRSVNVES